MYFFIKVSSQYLSIHSPWPLPLTKKEVQQYEVIDLSTFDKIVATSREKIVIKLLIVEKLYGGAHLIKNALNSSSVKYDSAPDWQPR